VESLMVEILVDTPSFAALPGSTWSVAGSLTRPWFWTSGACWKRIRSLSRQVLEHLGFGAW